MKRPNYLLPYKRIIGLILLLFAGFILFPQITGKKTTSSPYTTRHPEWSRNANIYEVNIRQYTPEGTFNAFAGQLPRLHKMGVDILWLMPVNPIGIKNRKGTLGSYYSVKDYLGINPEFGTLSDFKELVQKAHALGMHVIIDWVANHTSWDNDLITAHPEWYTHDSSGKIIAPVPDWTDVADLDYSNKALWAYMKDAFIYWIKNSGIDGFRCDVAGMIPTEFWQYVIPEVRKVKNVFMLAEWETPELHAAGFDMTYSWNFYHLMNDIAKGTKSATAIDTMLVNEKKDYPPDAYRMLFTTNHDENSWNGTEFERLGDGAKAFTVLSYTLPGMPLMYSGQESAFNRRLKFFDKDSIDWDQYRFSGFFTTLNKLKNGSPVLANGDAGGTFLKINTNNDKQVFCFLRKKGDLIMVVVVNLSGDTQKVQFTGNLPDEEYSEIFTKASFHFTHRGSVILNPWEYRVYQKNNPGKK
jgi:cyclomaltodextrinase / maltogenic alpha-amylase / neopullulanase